MTPEARIRSAVLAVFTTALMVGAGSMLYAKNTQEASDQQWCTILSLLVTRFHAPGWKPPDPAAAQYAASIELLYEQFKCADVTPLGPAQTPSPSGS